MWKRIAELLLGAPPSPPPQPPLAADEASLRDLLKQQHLFAHDNIKQLFTSFIAWYTFFWTVNVVAMGWLCSAGEPADTKTLLSNGRVYVYLLFVVLNILAICSCLVCRHAALALRNDAIEAAKLWAARLTIGELPPLKPDAGIMPSRITTYMFLSCAVSLVINALAWAVLLVVLLN
jgi:hypothetical protein